MQRAGGEGVASLAGLRIPIWVAPENFILQKRDCRIIYRLAGREPMKVIGFAAGAAGTWAFRAMVESRLYARPAAVAISAF